MAASSPDGLKHRVSFTGIHQPLGRAAARPCLLVVLSMPCTSRTEHDDDRQPLGSPHLAVQGARGRRGPGDHKDASDQASGEHRAHGTVRIITRRPARPHGRAPRPPLPGSPGTWSEAKRSGERRSGARASGEPPPVPIRARREGRGLKSVTRWRTHTVTTDQLQEPGGALRRRAAALPPSTDRAALGAAGPDGIRGASGGRGPGRKRVG